MKQAQATPMHTREEAIAWLLARGYVAIARDWSLGKSICIARQIVTVEPGIDAFKPTAVYVYPLHDGGWASTQPLGTKVDIDFASLQEALDFALEQLAAFEAYLTNMAMKPGSGQEGDGANRKRP